MAPANTYSFMNNQPLDLRLADELGFNPYYPQTTSRNSGTVTIDGTRYIDCASNDYLGLATDKKLSEAYATALQQFGVSLCGTPIAAGGNRATTLMEELIARFIGCEAAPTGTTSMQKAMCSRASSSM